MFAIRSGIRRCHYAIRREPTRRPRFSAEMKRAFRQLGFRDIDEALHCVLPYGLWRCGDGRQVLFNRWYQPIFERRGGEVRAADPTEWIDNIIEETWFYYDATPPWRCVQSLLLCQTILVRFGVDEKTEPQRLLLRDEQRAIGLIRRRPGGSPKGW
jgi:hypothetical protein